MARSRSNSGDGSGSGSRPANRRLSRSSASRRWSVPGHGASAGALWSRDAWLAVGRPRTWIFVALLALWRRGGLSELDADVRHRELVAFVNLIEVDAGWKRKEGEFMSDAARSTICAPWHARDKRNRTRFFWLRPNVSLLKRCDDHGGANAAGKWWVVVPARRTPCTWQLGPQRRTSARAPPRTRRIPPA